MVKKERKSIQDQTRTTVRIFAAKLDAMPPLASRKHKDRENGPRERDRNGRVTSIRIRRKQKNKAKRFAVRVASNRIGMGNRTTGCQEMARPEESGKGIRSDPAAKKGAKKAIPRSQRLSGETKRTETAPAIRKKIGTRRIKRETRPVF